MVGWPVSVMNPSHGCAASRMPRRYAGGLGLTIVVLATPVSSQIAIPGQAPREVVQPSRRVAVTTRTAEAPTLDGNLDDRAWQLATPMGDFVQAEPLEGMPATEKTEVRLL